MTGWRFICTEKSFSGLCMALSEVLYRLLLLLIHMAGEAVFVWYSNEDLKIAHSTAA